MSQHATTRRKPVVLDVVLLAVCTLPIWGTMAWLWYESTQAANCKDQHSIRAVAHWFDPVFFQYNLLLSAFAILIVPAVPLLYVRAMTGRKERRLRQEIPADQWPRIDRRLNERSSYKFYLGSASLATIVVALGVSILLLFKPVRDAAECGVDFSKGANILMLGPFIQDYGNGAAPGFEQFYGHLMLSLVGFQFGFLGAYIYFLSSLTRAYFQLDLTPETMIDGAIRIAVASSVSLVLSFVVGQTGHPEVMPVLSFFFGFFPKRALAVIESYALTLVPGASKLSYTMTPLSALHGLTYDHQLRLEREGFDDAENLSHADPVELAARTGFSYSQLCQWKSEAWLAAHLGEDYAAFVQLTGLLGRTELEHFVAASNGAALISPADADPAHIRLRNKLQIIRMLLDVGADPAPAAARISPGGHEDRRECANPITLRRGMGPEHA